MGGSAPSEPPALQLGRYRLVQQLGAGGMAQVYRAIVDGPRGFQRSFVVKRILPELATETDFINMLVTEARLCSYLQHPGIVQVHELGEENGEYFLVMEHVDGLDLAALLSHFAKTGRQIPLGLACYIIHELAAALAYAHALRDGEGRALEIVHRDISPSNIMLTNAGGVKLLDFGIAKAASHLRDERTRTGTLKGKISYLSPEQAEGEAIDRRADIFALGIVFHEILTMKRLFRSGDDFVTLKRVREARIDAPSLSRSEITPGLDTIVLRMLARRREDRYQSCDEIVTALKPIVHDHEADANALRAFLTETASTREPVAITTPEATRDLGPHTVPQTLSRSNGEIVRRPTDTYREPIRKWPTRIAVAIAPLLAGAFWLSQTHRTHDIRSVSSVAPTKSIQIANTSSTSSSTPTAVEAPPLSPPITRTSTTPPAPTVHLGIHGTDGAELLVDGKSIGHVPEDVTLERQKQPRTITVRKPGYQSVTRRVAGNESTNLVVTLKRKEQQPTDDDLADPYGSKYK